MNDHEREDLRAACEERQEQDRKATSAQENNERQMADLAVQLEQLRAQFAAFLGIPGHTGRPIPLDFHDDATLTASLAALSDTDRERLRRVVHNTDSNDNRRMILAEIHAALGANAVGVRFSTREEDDGHVLRRHGTVLFTDGTIQSNVTFGLALVNALNKEYPTVGSHCTVAVDLRDDTFVFTANDRGSIHHRFGLSTPPDIDHSNCFR